MAFARRARFRDVGRPGAAWLYGIAAKELSHWFRNQAVELKMVRRLAIEVKHDCWVPDALAARVQKLVDGMPAWAGYRVRVDRSLVEGPCGSVTHPDGMGARSIDGMIDTSKHEVLVTVNAARSTLDLLDGPESMQLVRAFGALSC